MHKSRFVVSVSLKRALRIMELLFMYLHIHPFALSNFDFIHTLEPNLIFNIIPLARSVDASAPSS